MTSPITATDLEEVIAGWAVARFAPIPCINNESGGAVLPVFPALIVLKNTEGFRWVIIPHDFCWVEKIAQIVLCQAVQFGDPRIDFSTRSLAYLGSMDKSDEHPIFDSKIAHVETPYKLTRPPSLSGIPRQPVQTDLGSRMGTALP